MGRRVLTRRDNMAHAQWVLDLQKKQDKETEEKENSIYESVKHWIICGDSIKMADIPSNVINRFFAEGMRVYFWNGAWTWQIRDYEQEKRDSYGD